MAFGINRQELLQWKRSVKNGEIAFLTHYWQDDRFPNCYTVTKVGCIYIPRLVSWGKQYNLDSKWIDHHYKYPHFDLFGERQKRILEQEGLISHLQRFKL